MFGVGSHFRNFLPTNFGTTNNMLVGLLLLSNFISQALSISTNECFASLALPVPAICSLNANGCRLNSAFMMIAGPMIEPLGGVCGWDSETVEVVPQFTYQCTDDDVSLDSYRLMNAMMYYGYLRTIYNVPYNESCYSKSICLQSIQNIMSTDATMEFPFGLGKYYGHSEICDYLGLPTSAIGRDLVNLINTPSPHDYAVFSAVDIKFGSFGNTVKYFGMESTNEYHELTFEFSGCSRKITAIHIGGVSTVTGMETISLINSAPYYLAAQEDLKMWGTYSICATHQDHCTGQYKQFKNFGQCLKHMRNLPIKTDECGTTKILMGNALPCKLKHAMMVPINPEHCYHLGPEGTADSHGKIKCSAATECVNLTNPNYIPWSLIESLDIRKFVKKNKNVYYPPKVCAGA